MAQENNQSPNIAQNEYSINRPNIVGHSDRFQFTPISEIFDTPNPAIENSQLTQEYINVIDYIAPSINNIYPSERSNYNNPSPNYPTGNYDFSQTAYPSDSNFGNPSADPAVGLYYQVEGSDDSPIARAQRKLAIPDPMYFSKSATANR